MLLSLVGIFLATSCQKPENPQPPNDGQDTLHVDYRTQYVGEYEGVVEIVRGNFETGEGDTATVTRTEVVALSDKPRTIVVKGLEVELDATGRFLEQMQSKGAGYKYFSGFFRDDQLDYYYEEADAVRIVKEQYKGSRK